MNLLVSSSNTSDIPEALINQIVDMGFSHTEAKNALQIVGNSVEEAITLLTSQM